MQTDRKKEEVKRGRIYTSFVNQNSFFSILSCFCFDEAVLLNKRSNIHGCKDLKGVEEIQLYMGYIFMKRM